MNYSDGKFSRSNYNYSKLGLGLLLVLLINVAQTLPSPSIFNLQAMLRS